MSLNILQKYHFTLPNIPLFECTIMYLRPARCLPIPFPLLEHAFFFPAFPPLPLGQQLYSGQWNMCRSQVHYSQALQCLRKSSSSPRPQAWLLCCPAPFPFGCEDDVCRVKVTLFLLDKMFTLIEVCSWNISSAPFYLSDSYIIMSLSKF